ncbi:MAG: UDP-3-O-(3-hydroxymyristoyl)glucosamine N-acyltransferase [Candidatus Rifleibacteriota bacterium]
MHSQNNRLKVTLKELAETMGGVVHGDPTIQVSGIASILRANSEQITFLSGAKNYAAHLEKLKKSKAAAVIAPEDAPEVELPSIRLKNSYYGLIRALELFHPVKKPDYLIHPSAFVSENAELGSDVVIGPNAVVESGAVIGNGSWIEAQAYIGRNVRIGNGVRIFPGVRILESCVVGDRSVIHSNTVIGSDGFGFTQYQGKQLKIPQVGNVVIESDVEIGSCVTVDRATMESTVIGEGTKIDNLVHIAHNVIIGKNCTIVAQVGISGSTILEDQVTLAGQVGTVGHVTVGKGTTVAARGVVTTDVEPGSFVSGFPIKPHQEERRILASMRKLPELVKKVRELEKKIEEKE